MSALLLDEKVVRIAQALEEAHIAYAFGGAIALAYYGTPRGTGDIDMNVFAPPEDARSTIETLQRLGSREPPLEEIARLKSQGQLRLHWSHTPIDIFFTYDTFHTSCEERVRRVPFADIDINILSAEDLMVFKVIHGRPKDQRDIREMLLCMGERIDTEYVTTWLTRFLAEDDDRLSDFSKAIAERVPGQEIP